jgi:hypothetical protein
VVSANQSRVGSRLFLVASAVGVSGLIGSSLMAAGAESTTGSTAFGRPALVAGMSSGWTEPRVVTAPDGTEWTVTNDPANGTATVLSSSDGTHWKRTPTAPPGQQQPSTDVDIAVTAQGRVIVTELDGAGLNFITDYSDDRGKTWSTAQGTQYADTDRPWLAVGPNDPATHLSRVYLLFHNLLSGSAMHEMFVETSTDGGATFGAPVPITLPGSQAFADLQCADSGAPSAIVVDRHTGQIYAVFGTRSSVAGGCGASATGTFEINVVGETRIWVATSKDGSVGSWTDTLAFDGAPDTISASFETAAIDAAGAAYISFSQTAHAYPDFSQAAVRYVFTTDKGQHWSHAVTVTSGSPVGTYDPTVVAGRAGELLIAYDLGVPAQSGGARWSTRFARVSGATTTSPHISRGIVDARPAYAESANAMGGSCASGPLAGAENGLACDRASDDFGITLDRSCRVLVVYPMEANSAPGAAGGTWSALQRAGSRIC